VEASEIIERTLYPMINEGAKILNEGIAARASDIDLVWVHGYGFPPAKGGPMYWAQETVGVQALNERLSFWRDLTGNPLFAPADPAWLEKNR
jgi:3-hydroxyacyl-CoA dehydrogenase